MDWNPHLPTLFPRRAPMYEADSLRRPIFYLQRAGSNVHDLELGFLGASLQACGCWVSVYSCAEQPTDSCCIAAFVGHTTLTVVVAYLRVSYLLHGAESFLRSQLVLQLIRKFPAFFRTRKFITVLTSSRQLSLS